MEKEYGHTNEQSINRGYINFIKCRIDEIEAHKKTSNEAWREITSALGGLTIRIPIVKLTKKEKVIRCLMRGQTASQIIKTHEVSRRYVFQVKAQLKSEGKCLRDFTEHDE